MLDQSREGTPVAVRLECGHQVFVGSHVLFALGHAWLFTLRVLHLLVQLKALRRVRVVPKVLAHEPLMTTLVLRRPGRKKLPCSPEPHREVARNRGRVLSQDLCCAPREGVLVEEYSRFKVCKAFEGFIRPAHSFHRVALICVVARHVNDRLRSAWRQSRFKGAP